MLQECKKLFVLNDLSTYRSNLMGWSIIWIMMLHFRFSILKPLGFIAQYGYAGVEIFMFVSGIGLYFSLDKNSHIVSFYKKRLKRIFPVYFFVGIFASIFLFHDDIYTYFFRYTTIGFWFNLPYFEWYIPAIVVLYLAAPYIKKMCTPQFKYILFTIALFFLVSAFFAAKYQIFDRSHFFLYYRVPAFMLGMYTGLLIKHKQSTKPYIYTLLAGIPVFCMCYPMHYNVYEFKYYSIFFLLPLFMLIICMISRLPFKINSMVQKVGDASLEIYLIQTLFFIAIIDGILIIPQEWHDAVTIGLMAICTCSGILLHRWFYKMLQATHAYFKAAYRAMYRMYRKK